MVAWVLLFAALIAAWTCSSAQSASSAVTVTLDVASATSLDASGCVSNTPGVTAFGTVLPGTGAVTAADCAITFGSSNDSSMLRLSQQDGGGGAMVPGPSSGIVAWWPLNGNGEDIAPSPTTLAFTGGAFTAAGPTGYDQARTQTVNGDRATAAWKASYDLTTFTVDAWFRTSVQPGFHWLVLKESGGNRNFGIYYDATPARFNVAASVGGSMQFTNGTSAVALTDNAWHHIAMVSSGSALSLYIDGSLIDTRAYGGALDTPNAPVAIGSTAGGGTTWKGEIDEVRIHSVARTAVEIRSYFQSALPNYQTGVADWSVGSGMFGACLRSVGVGVTATWSADAACQMTSAAYWNPIAPTSGTPSAKVASAATPGSYTANLRFGVRTPPSQRPGSYIAPVTIEVIAPTA